MLGLVQALHEVTFCVLDLETTGTDPGWDEITLPESKDLVRIKPLTIKESKFILNRPSDHKKKFPTQVLKVLLPVLEVGGGSPDSFDELVQWYSALDPQDKSHLDRMENELYPHLRSDVDFVCDSCGHQFEIPLKFDESFF